MHFHLTKIVAINKSAIVSDKIWISLILIQGTVPTRVEIGGSAKPNFDRLARLYRMVGGYPEVIRTQLPVIEEQ